MYSEYVIPVKPKGDPSIFELFIEINDNQIIAKKHIFSYLLSHLPLNSDVNNRHPSIEIFKIAMLNKQFLKTILSLYKPLRLRDFNNNLALNKLIDCLYLPVDLIEKYHNSSADVFRYSRN